MAHIVKRTTERGENRYDVRTRIGGRVVTRTFKRRKDADAYATTLESDKLRGVVIDPRRSGTPFQDVAAGWMDSTATKRGSSVARDRSIIDQHLLPALGSRQVGSITKEDLQTLVDGCKDKQAPSTIGRQYSALRALFSWAEESEYIARTPCRDIRLPSVRLVDRPELSAKQLTALGKALGPDQAVMMWVGAALGLRWAECAGLTADRVDFSAQTITVNQQLSRSGSLVVPKSAASNRTVAAPKWLVTDLSNLARRRGIGRDSDSLLFVRTDGGALNYMNWRIRTWVPACERAGLPGLKFHDLRSLAASYMIAAGVDVKTAQTRLGHSSPQVTLGIYARATAENDRLAADAIGAMVRPASRSRSARKG
jgi:integrase